MLICNTANLKENIHTQNKDSDGMDNSANLYRKTTWFEAAH